MAKSRKKSHHRRTSHRRGVGSAHVKGMQLLEMAGAAVLGQMGGRMLANSVGRGKDPKLVGAGQMVAGYLIANKIGGPLGVGAGIGMAANGAVDILHSMGVIKGPYESDTYVLNGGPGDEFISGYNSFISGEDGVSGDSDFVAGMDEINGVGDAGGAWS